jgi:sulfonate transport system permease protein
MALVERTRRRPVETAAFDDAAVALRQEVATRVLSKAKGLLVPLALLIAWEALSRFGVFAPHLVPSPTAVFDELAYLWNKGVLVEHVWTTTYRVILGFAAGTLVATVLGSLTGASRLARELLDPTLQALKAVPSLAWVPLFILWFGIFETSKVSLIAVGVFFPVYLNLMSAIQDSDRKLVEVGRIYRLTPWQQLRYILVPSTLPAYVVGLRSGLALGWMFVIAAELMGASKGLGFLMIDGQMTGHPASIVGSLILFALVGKATDGLIALASRPLLSWQDSFGKMNKGAGNA